MSKLSPHIVAPDPTENAAIRKVLSIVFALIIYASAVFAFGFGLSQDAHALSPSDVAGDWATPGLGAVVRLAPCNDDAERLCGRLVWAWDPSRLRHGAGGSALLRDFRWSGSAFTDGALTNPEDGRTYSGSIRPDGDVLRLRGCAGPFCQTQVWRRLSSIPRP